MHGFITSPLILLFREFIEETNKIAPHDMQSGKSSEVLAGR